MQEKNSKLTAGMTSLGSCAGLLRGLTGSTFTPCLSESCSSFPVQLFPVHLFTDYLFPVHLYPVYLFTDYLFPVQLCPVHLCS